MKKLLLTLIVALGMCGSSFAQYDSYWPDFNGNYFPFQGGIVATIMIDGEIINTDAPNWDALEVAAFVGEECRANDMYMINDNMLEYGDPYPVLDGYAIYYNNGGETVTFKMYDHANEVLYETCEILYLGGPLTIHTGEDHFEGWNDPENPIFLNFTTSAPACTITVPYEETFETYTTDMHLYTFVTPECWTVAHQYYRGSELYEGGVDTLPQIYRAFNHTPGGNYSLRIKYRSILAMPELDESVDLSRLRLQMYVRQPHTYYNLEVGMMSDLEDESTFEPIATVRNMGHSMTYFECGFNNYQGEGRYIAFRNVGGSDTDPYCSNYLDDITLTYVDAELPCAQALPYEEDFESVEGVEQFEIQVGGGTGVEPRCWEIVTEDVDMDSYTKPQIYGGFNMEDGELSDNGSYSLRLKNRCVYAMPELTLPAGTEIQDLSMSFSLRQAKSPYRLQVGVVDNEGEFGLVKTINLPVDDPVQEVLVDFAEYEGNGNRIAFRNTTNRYTTIEYSTNYIDDIYVDLTSEFENVEGRSGNVIDNVDAYLESIDVYPNPTTGNVYIDAVDVQKVECYNQMGQLVGVYDNANELNISDLSNGVYMLRITVPQGMTMRKVVKK